MPKRKRKTGNNFNKPLLVTAITSGTATLVIRLLNRRLKIPELGEIAGICGTVMVICLILLIGIWVVKRIK